MPAATTIDTPAVLGGAPAVTASQDEAHRWPILTEADERAVLEVLRSGDLSIHPVVSDLEDDFRQWLGVEHAVAHNNGTGALHAAMHALEISAGDEVIVPSATWWASVMPVLHQGAVPVFAETEFDCGGLDPADVEAKITDRTKAIVVVHLFGMPSKMDALTDVARRHGLRVLEDASHAHGATYHGRPVGTLGDAAVFSMQANKLVPSAEGGVLVTNDAELRDRVIRYGHYERLLRPGGRRARLLRVPDQLRRRPDRVADRRPRRGPAGRGRARRRAALPAAPPAADVHEGGVERHRPSRSRPRGPVRV
jgi:hypothetical protein